MDYSIRIGGEAGQGIQTIGDALGKVFSRSGYHVFTHQDYESRVRGGHNYYQVRFSDSQVTAPVEKIDILVAMDKNSIPLYEKDLHEHGHIVHDSSSIGKFQTSRMQMDVPFVTLATEHGGSRIMENTVATGAVLGMLGMGLDLLNEIITAAFQNKGEDVVLANLASAKAGYEFSVKECLRCSFSAAERKTPRMLINGIEAIALGAIASGCKFYSAYPMTPSTGIMLYLAGKAKEFGIVVEQAEDEIAAINMAIGASFAGARSMTGTAGGGFALMVEGLSLAGMTETPIIIAVGQRPAPATGLPTRTEQGDLLYVLHSAHGEFPRVILTPGTPEQAFYLTNKAFDIAEKYQVPVFIIFDQHLADTQWTYEGFDTGRIVYRDYRIRGESLVNLPEYKRHAFTENGVSPMAIPGASNHLVVTDSDEHDEDGHLIEDAATRIKMVNKRLFQKLPLIRREIEPPLHYGHASPEIIINGWGSTYGVMKESVDVLSEEWDIAMLHFTELFPFPSTRKLNYLKLLRDAKLTICIENNATSQFARLMRTETGYSFNRLINRYDGRPFTSEGLIKEIEGVL
jgi:2-oxoglutarate ferredoxin oxidoreductase subunit alpha